MMTLPALYSLTVFRNVARTPAMQALMRCVTHAAVQDTLVLADYTELVSAMTDAVGTPDLALFLRDAVLHDDNAVTRAFAAHRTPDPILLDAAREELATLAALATLNCEAFVAATVCASPACKPYALRACRFASGALGVTLDSLKAHCEQNGVGEFARYAGFAYTAEDGLVPVRHVDPITLGDLKQYELQRKELVDNTEAFLKGLPYQNVLLYGDRGTGKSSTVKALLNAYRDKGLRIVELNKTALGGLDRLIRELEDVPLRFIIFIDDLSFREDDDTFGLLKAALEGSLSVRPKNVAIYATSNRRHLVRETFSAREGNEVHAADTRDEMLSLSDRFGLTVTFLKPNKNDYLAIVHELARDAGLVMPTEVLDRGAEQWALTARTPRVAKQYVDYLLAHEKA